MTKLILTTLLALTLAGCGQARLPQAGGLSAAAALEALAKKKKATPTSPRDAGEKATTGTIATKLTGYWEEGACMLTIAPAAGEATNVLVGGETIITDAKGKPVATTKLKRGMTVEVTLGAVSKIKSEPPTYVATKLVVKKAAPKPRSTEAGEDYDGSLDL